MRNIINWLKSHSIFDYILILIVILFIINIVQLPGAISKNNNLKSELNNGIAEYNKEWDASEAEAAKNGTTESSEQKTTYKAKNADEIANAFVIAQNNLIKVYMAEADKNNGTVANPSEVTSIVKATEVFGTGVTPQISGGVNNIIVDPASMPNFTISTSKLTPVGKQQYNGIFTLTANDKTIGKVAYVYDSSKNTIGNLVPYMNDDLIQSMN